MALTFSNVIGDLLPERANLTLQGGTTFRLTSNADIPFSRMIITGNRQTGSIATLLKGQGNH